MKDATKDLYRECFSTQAGKAVLANMLIEAGFFDSNLKTTEELAVLNFMTKVIKKVGLTDGKDVTIFVQKLIEITGRRDG